MATYTLSPVGGAGAQFFDDNGVPLSGGKIYTYAAGTTTPQSTWIDPTGATPNANPIVLDSAGRPPQEIWLSVAYAYKFVTKTSNDVLIRTYDNIPGLPQPALANDADSILYTQGNTVTAGGFVVGNTYMIASVGSTNFVAIGAAANSIGVVFVATGAGSGTGTAYNVQTVAQKFQQTVSVKDFGAVGDWNGTQSSPGTGTDDTVAIQAAIDYCVTNGAGLFFPPGRYRTTAPLVIDRSFNGQDPINGGMYGIALEGAGAASCQIASDHNGVCIDFTGGSGAGWHTYFNVSGIGLLKANYARNAGSVGLSMDQSAFFSINRFDITGFEYGIDAVDCLSGSFEDGTIRLNNYGWRFQKGTRSHPNNISFRGVTTINNQIWGGQVIQPSLFGYIGGAIESNGFTGIPGDTSSWGVDIQNGGTEGSVAVNFIGVYIEGNNGRADVKILSDTRSATYNFNGCSFLRFQDVTSRFTTNNIFFNSITESRLVVSGCGFKDFAPYTSSAAREFIAANTAQVIDSAGNIFLDTSGGNTGIDRVIFSPLGTNHQIPFAALPNVVKYRNGIQYCADGTGSSEPSLAVSDGTNWWQIPLGQFSGRVASAGTALRLPRGWSCSKPGTGIYTITHNLNLSANTYAVVATPSGAPGRGYCSGMVLSGNTFEIYFANTSGSATDMDFNFNMQII